MSPEETILYTAKTITFGGRMGHALSSDSRLDVDLSLPYSMDRGTNPEQLFAAAWSACFNGALERAAGSLGLRLPADASVAAEVDLIIDDEAEFTLQARLNVSLPGFDLKIAQAIVNLAHQLCPFSKATRGNINVVVRAI